MASSSPQAPLLPALIFLLSALIWLPLELYTIQYFNHGVPEGYSFLIESLSDLGVNYRQVHELKHYNVTSFAFQVFNANLYQAGVGFALGQLSLLFLTRRNAVAGAAAAAAATGGGVGKGFVRTVRGLLAVLVLLGFSLFATVHGGPREKFWKIIGWHWMGFALVGLAGNLNSFVAAMGSSQVGGFEGGQIYRLISAMLAGFGLYSYYRFNTLGEWHWKTNIGLWQRGTVYPVLAWELLTGVLMLREALSGTTAKPKKT